MTGTYTKLKGTEYTFIHDSIFEICAYHYGKQFPEQMLKYMNSTYIANCVKPWNKETKDMFQKAENPFDLCIRLHNESQNSMLAERLYRDVERMDLYNVFMNDALKHQGVCQAFIEVLKRKDYRELKSLFLDQIHGVHAEKFFDEVKTFVQGKSNKDFMRSEQEEIGNSLSSWKTSCRFKHVNLLMGINYTRSLKRKNFTSTFRVISWVIYYGHHQILQYIIDQTKSHREIQSVIFLENRFQALVRLMRKSKEYQREKKRLFLLSCLSGDVETLQIMLQYVSKIGALLNQGGAAESWSAPLVMASKEGLLRIVEELIKVGADVNQQGKYDTPLTAACRGGHTLVVKMLIKSGSVVDLPNMKSETPIMIASLHNPSVLKILTENGACFEQKS
ncbi:uncharacterized protein LOC134280147 [Saccostrea cucullata]|uniref:uncharacterized protein LOC134280147 n=1 Tax=Saccostrea cuccullata TaxID=36930 RepID=UPI002ED4696A